MSPPVERVLAALESCGSSVRVSGKRRWQAQCPVHDDRNPSLSIAEGDDGRVLLYCQARSGCTAEEIVAVLGLELRDLFADHGPSQGLERRRPTESTYHTGRAFVALPSAARLAELHRALLADHELAQRLNEERGWTQEAITKLGVGFDGQRIVFPVCDRDGQLVNVARYKPGGNPKMLASTGRPRDLFPAPETLGGDVAWVVEGEADAVSAHSIGLPAIGIPGVAFVKRLLDHADRFSRFRQVNVALDCDTQGRDAAREIATGLADCGVNVRVVDLNASRDDSYDLGDLAGESAQDGWDGLANARRLLERMAADAEPVLASRVVSEEAFSDAPAGSLGWPARPDVDAFHGLVGEITRTIEPHTEGDAAAVLVSLLVAYGNVIGRGAGWKHGGTFHATNVYALLVGPTSSGRKGTAGDEAHRVFEMVDAAWAHRQVVSGLSSGEGLVWQVRDPIMKRRKAKKDEIPTLPDGWLEEVDDPGEEDKRLLVVEAEFSQALKVMKREGNTLSPTVRRLWDRGDARSLVKMSPGRTTGSLVSIVGHISPEELRRQLDDAEISNGFANRFLIVCSRRSKLLPFGGNLTDEELARRFAPRLREAIEHGRRCRELGMDESARATWDGMYGELGKERFGLLGTMLARGVPIVRRLAVIYALLDCQSVVREEHLRAAAAVWRYCEDSARFVFGDEIGSRLADRLRQALRDADGEWVTREQLRKAAGSNSIPAADITAALGLLLDHGLAESRKEATGGRPVELWRSAESPEEREGRELSPPPGHLSSSSSLSSPGGGRDDNGHVPFATPEEEARLERATQLLGGES